MAKTYKNCTVDPVQGTTEGPGFVVRGEGEGGGKRVLFALTFETEAEARQARDQIAPIIAKAVITQG